MQNRLIRIKTVMDMTGKSRSAIYADMAAGVFPRSIALGPKSVAWSEAAIVEWIEAKIKGVVTKYPKAVLPVYYDELGDI